MERSSSVRIVFGNAERSFSTDRIRILFCRRQRSNTSEWRKIVVAAGVSGIQVHDARMVAAMRVHGIANLLTLNAKDFRRFSGITVLSPDEVLASFS